MSRERHNRVGEVFLAARGLDGPRRGAYLDAACAGDASLRDEVQSLLDADAEGTTFLAAATGEGPGPRGRMDSSQRFVGARLGRYTLRRVIGTGGMGTVYEAEQLRPRRVVALKMMRQGLPSPSAVRRFEYECHLLARLRHPAIAQIFDADVYAEVPGGAPYFVMEYIADPRTLTEYVRSEKTPLHRKLDLFAEVCDAVHHAHQNGVIHRDLKPENILVGADGQPKVIDFGVARALASDVQTATMHTTAGHLLGTLAYMSPEQAAGDPDRIDTRTDVYSLGVILYQMLTGRFPYPTHGALTEVLENIRHAEPKAPRSVDRRVGDELETIVLKCLQKEKDRRYQSANELGRDIQRYLKGDAIEAKRDSAWYVLRKSVKRHRGPVTAAVAFVLLLIGALMVSVTLLGKTRSAESRATDQYESAKRISDFYSGLLLKMDRWHPKALTFGVAPGEVRLSDLVREAARLVPDAFGDRPDLAADLQYKIGRALVGLGLEEEAERVFRDSYEQARAALGDDHPAALALWRNIGLSLLARDAWADAVHVLEEVAKQSVRALGEDHHQSLYGLMALNWSMRLSERVEDSEQLSRRSLAALRRALGEDDPLHVEALTQHAVVLLFHGKLEEAEAVARQAVDQAGAIGGGRSEYRAFALASLQHVRAMQERWPDAAELAREEVQLRRAVDGPNHFQTDCAVLTLVIALSRTGECEESLALGREVVAREARQAGVPDAVRVYGASNLVYALLNCGDAREAERLARETLDSLGAVASPSPGSHMSVRLALADALDAQGRTAEAQATAVEALRDGLAAGAPITSHDWGGLFYPGWYPLRNRCLIRMGLYAEAEWRLLADHQRLTSASAPDHARTRSIISDLVALYETWNAAGPASGCAEKAAQWRARLLALPPVAALGTKSADPRNGDNGE